MENEKIFRESEGLLVTDSDGNRYMLFPIPTEAPPFSKLIRSTFTELGVPHNLTGIDYVVTAIELYKKSPKEYKRAITTKLYPAVAKKHCTTANSVEQAIKYTVESCNVTSTYTEIFGTECWLTNTRFIVALAKLV